MLDAVLATHLLFGRGQIDEIIGTGLVAEVAEGEQKREQAGTVIVAAQSV